MWNKQGEQTASLIQAEAKQDVCWYCPPCILLLTAHSFAIFCLAVCWGGILTPRDNSVTANLFFPWILGAHTCVLCSHLQREDSPACSSTELYAHMERTLSKAMNEAFPSSTGGSVAVLLEFWWQLSVTVVPEWASWRVMGFNCSLEQRREAFFFLSFFFPNSCSFFSRNIKCTSTTERTTMHEELCHHSYNLHLNTSNQSKEICVQCAAHNH